MTLHGEAGQQRRQRLRGAVIGGAFGAAYLLANAHTPLEQAAADLFRALAVLGFGVLLVAAQRARIRPGPPVGGEAPVNLFGSRLLIRRLARRG